MSSVSECLSYNLRELRKRAGLTQDGLAQRASLSLPAVQLIESGKRWPERDTIAALAAALGVEESRLFVDPSLTQDIGKSLLDVIRAVGESHPEITAHLDLTAALERRAVSFAAGSIADKSNVQEKGKRGQFAELNGYLEKQPKKP